MATAKTWKDNSACSICFGDNKTPCVLPECGHRFCENCLLAYINNLHLTEEDYLDFNCPNCREQVSLPRPIDGNIQAWIKTLISSECDTEMEVSIDFKEETDINTCASCKNANKTAVAEVHCIECQEKLCAGCSKIRHGTKLLAGHSIIDLQLISVVMTDNDRTVVTKKLLNSVKCDEHPDKIVTSFCRADDELCCDDCVIENHRHCDTITNLNSEAIAVETDVKVHDILEHIKRIASKVELLKVYKNDNLVDTKHKSERITQKIGQIRTKLNVFLDTVEENVNSNAKAFVKECVIDADTEKTKLNDLSKSLEEYKSLIERTDMLGYPSKSFIVLKNLMPEIDDVENKVLTTAKQIYNSAFELELKIEPVLNDLLSFESNNVNQVASVVKRETKIPIPGFEVRQLLVEGYLEKTAEYEVAPKHGDCSAFCYSSIVYRRKNEGMILTSVCSGHECVCLTNKKFHPIACIKKGEMSGKPYDATDLRNGDIAVSIPDNRQICFFSEQNATGELKISGYISTKYRPKSIHGLSNGDIAISWNDPTGFGILHFKCNLYEAHFEERAYFHTDKAGRKLKTFDFMAIDEKGGHVIQPCTEDKAVYCFDFDGNPNFKYSHEDLVYPRGVSISGDGNVFICDEKKSAIHVISPEGEGLYVLKTGCPEKPLAIAFDESGTQFALSQRCEPWKLIRIFRLA